MTQFISLWHEIDDLAPRALYAMLKLRMDVFIVEQNCAFAEIDGKDIGAFHLRILDGEELAACLRVLPPEKDTPVKIGRVVVAPNYRGYKLGQRLMQEAVDFAQARFPATPLSWAGKAICKNSTAPSALLPFQKNIWKTIFRISICASIPKR